MTKSKQEGRKAPEKIDVPAPLVSPISVFHARFPTEFPTVAPKYWNTYHRSTYKLLEGVSTEDAKYIGNQTAQENGMYSKIGTFYNPYKFAHYKKRITPSDQASEITHLPANFYNRLLTFQKIAATYVVKKINEFNYGRIQVNADYDYTCVLISVAKPQEVKNTKDWTNFLSLFLMVLMNKLALERGINIEIHRRASFGFLRPAISECGASIRINLGLCPQEYLDLVIDALDYLATLEANLSIFKTKINNAHLNTLYTKYKAIKKTSKTAAQTTLWDNLWCAADSKNHSFIYQIFRKEHVIEYLVDLISIECAKQTLEELFNKLSDMKRAFATPFLKILQAYTLKDESLTINDSQMKHLSFKWTHSSKIEDRSFWLIFDDFATILGADKTDINKFITSATTDGLYNYLDSLTQQFYFNPSVTVDCATDGYGSDSECDEDLESDNEDSTVYAKKLITATGMRAIQLAYAVARLYLTERHRVNSDNYTVSSQYMYYETFEAIKKHSIPVSPNEENATLKKHSGIAFFDNNFCNTDHKPIKKLLTEILPTDDYICIVDVTCSTTDEMNMLLKDIFAKNKIKVVLFVSSGLKNEQSMSDLNPYGTVRIFALNKTDCDYIYEQLTDLEDEAKYKHPKESHLLRLQAKRYGMTPTNKCILQHDESSSDTPAP